MVREVLQAHIMDITMIDIVGLHIVANAEDSVIKDVEETIIDLNLTKSVKPHVLKNPPHHHMHPLTLHQHHMNPLRNIHNQHRNLLHKKNLDTSEMEVMEEDVRPLIMQDVGETRTNLIPKVNVKELVRIGVINGQKNVK